MDPKSTVKLCSDEFWDGGYLQRGAVAVIPEVVRNLCRAGKRYIVTKDIPPSIWQLFRQNAGAKSYAEKEYSRFEKPQTGYRKALMDSDDEVCEKKPSVDLEWSEGEGVDASDYKTEDISDVDDDDDATVRGSDSDDEMTEIEEWVPKP
jgi:hypothetical protein